MGDESSIERDAASCGERGRSTVVHRVGRHQRDPRVTMLRVVPAEKLLAMCTCIFDRAEAGRKVWPVLQGFEVRLGVRIVIRDVWPAVSFGDVEIDEKLGDRLRAHAGPAIGVQSQRTGHDILFIDGVGDELLGQLRGLPMSDHPADDVAAENIQNDVQVKTRPLGRPLDFGYVPTPDFIRPDREQFWLGVRRMTSLPAPIADLALRGQ